MDQSSAVCSTVPRTPEGCPALVRALLIQAQVRGRVSCKTANSCCTKMANSCRAKTANGCRVKTSVILTFTADFAADSCPDGISAISDKPPQLDQKLIKEVRFCLSSRSRRPPCGHGRTSGSPSRDRSLLCGRQLKFTQRLGAGCLSLWWGR